jgi:hypothetical protein
MFWEMIFRVILAYLRKLAGQLRGRLAGVSEDSLSRKSRLAAERGLSLGALTGNSILGS